MLQKDNGNMLEKSTTTKGQRRSLEKGTKLLQSKDVQADKSIHKWWLITVISVSAMAKMTKSETNLYVFIKLW